MVSGTWSGTADIQVQGYSGSGRRGVSYISQNGNCEKDMKVRIVKASAMFGKMKKVWRNKHINLQT